LTIIGLVLAYSLTGTFFVEVVFNWPGLGTFAVGSILNVDYPAIMGITLFGAAFYLIVNLVVDVLQAWLDPRIRLACWPSRKLPASRSPVAGCRSGCGPSCAIRWPSSAAPSCCCWWCWPSWGRSS